MADKDADPETLHTFIVLESHLHSNGYRYTIIADESDPAGGLLDVEATDDPLSLRLDCVEEEADKDDWQDLDQHVL